MSVKGVIFDVGGTLISSNGNTFEAANAWAAVDVFRAHGCSTKASALWLELRTLRRSFPKEGAHYRQIHTTRWALAELASRHGVKPNASFLARAERAFVNPEVRGSVLLPGVAEVVTRLQTQVKLAVVSNTRSHLLIEETLRQLGLRGAFDPFITSAGCGWRKPSPRIFRNVIETWGLPADQLVMVGDSLSNDVAGAKALGMRAIWLRTDAPEDLSCNADAVADTPLELLEVLAAWGRGLESS